MPDSPEKVAETLALVRKSPGKHHHFFSELDSPDWIEPLSEAGFFRRPPSAAQEFFLFDWPQSKYLLRMAPIAPRRVARAMEDIPLNDNLAVHVDLTRAAVHLRDDGVAAWAAKEAEWVAGWPLAESPDLISHALADALGALVDRLAVAGSSPPAISLTRALLEIRVVRASVSVGSCEARIGPHQYREFVGRRLPSLLERGGVEVLTMLCDLIERSVATSGLDASDRVFSRPAIELGGHGAGDDVSDALVEAVRDSSVSLVDSGVPVRSVVAAMERQGPAIFKRIVLHLAADRCGADPDLAAELALDRTNFDDRRLLREYGRLLGSIFPRLAHDRKSVVLGWIEDGPPDGRSALGDGDERRLRRLRWQTRRLVWIREHLNGEWSRRYAAMVAEVGEPGGPGLGSDDSAWIEPRSPVSADELRAMSAAAVLEYLGRWEPSGDPGSPNREGLADELKWVVAGSPERFVEKAEAFLELPGVYAKALVRGLHEVDPDDAYVDWKVIVPVMSRMVDSHRSDPDWRGARLGCAGLLWMVLREGGIDIELREPVWSVIDGVCDDAGACPAERETPAARRGTKSSIGAREMALHAVVQYALWVRWHETLLSRGSRSVFDMDAIPEVRRRLERHLDPEFERSPAVREVYGRWFVELCLIDEEWVRGNAGRMFPGDQPPLRDAAWDAYLRSCPPSTARFVLLRRQYGAAVRRMAEPGSGRLASKEDAVWRLGHHLVLAAGRGALSTPDDDDLVGTYVLNAGSANVREAVLQVARSLHFFGGEPGPDAACGFERLVDALLDLLEAERDRLAPLSSLGSWLVSGRFGVPWALSRLRRLVELAGAAEPAFGVMDYLTDAAGQHPAVSFRVLESWADGGLGRAFVAGRYGNLRQILRAALAEEDVRDGARDLVGRLGAAGHVQFRDLLEGCQHGQSR